MAGAAFTTAVVGSSPLAVLLAGLVAGETGQSVCLVADRFSPLKVDRGIDIAAAPVTRPETWALLGRSAVEAARLVSRIAGRAMTGRGSALFVAHYAGGATALAHMRQMAAAFGREVETVSRADIPGAVSAIRLNDVILLERSLFMAAVEPWLAARSVQRLFRDVVEMTLEVDGSLRVRAGTADLTASHAVLVDDRAILELVGAAGLSGLSAVTRTAFLSEPTAPLLPAPVVLHVDRGATFWRGRGGSIGAVLPGSTPQAAAEFGRLIGGSRPLHLAGQAVFPALASDDGAPVIGRLNGDGPTIIAGLGPVAAFLAPALARMVTGKSSDAEAAWAAVHRPGKDRQGVADYAPPAMEWAA